MSQSPKSGPSDAPAVRLEIVEDDVTFASLRASWNALAQRCASPSVFLRHEWFEAAWQWRRQDARLHILCAFRGAELVGTLPLIASRTTGHGSTRCLELLTVPDTQSCDLLAISGAEADVAQACLATLLQKSSEWDVLRLKYLRPSACALTQLTEAAARAGLSFGTSDAGRNPYLDLGYKWESFYATRSRRLKKANNLIANRLRKAGEIRVEWLESGTADPEAIARTVDTAIDISAQSWKHATGNSLDHPGPQAFLRRLSERAAECGWLSVWLLYLDNRPLAMEYQLAFEGDVHALRSDFNADCIEISPGSHLNRKLMEALFDRGYRRYFMGPGDNAYKFRWTEDAEPLAQLTIYGRSARGRWLAVWEKALKPQLRALRYRTPRGAGAGVQQQPLPSERVASESRYHPPDR